MFKFIVNHKKEVLISIGTGIILFCLEPLLRMLGNKSLDLLLSISKILSNAYYSDLAKQNTHIVGAIGTTISIIVVFILHLNLYVDLKKLKRKAQTRSRENLERISKMKEELINPNKEQRSKQEILADLDSLEKKSQLLKQSFEKKDITVSVLVVSMSILMVITYSYFIYGESITNRVVEYEQSLKKAKPNITAQQYDEINAKWASMTCEKDYDKIMTELKKAAK